MISLIHDFACLAIVSTILSGLLGVTVFLIKEIYNAI